MSHVQIQHYQIPHTVLRTEQGVIDVEGHWTQQECEQFVDAMRNRLYPHEIAETALGASLRKIVKSDREYALTLNALSAKLFDSSPELADPYLVSAR